jgi:hypothetical protein
MLCKDCGLEAEKLNSKKVCNGCAKNYFLNKSIKKMSKNLDKCFDYQKQTIKKILVKKRPHIEQRELWWDDIRVQELFGTKEYYNQWFGYHRKDFILIEELLLFRKKELQRGFLHARK